MSHTSCDEFIITGNDETPATLNLQLSRHDLRDQLHRAHDAVSDGPEVALSSSLSTDLPMAPRRCRMTSTTAQDESSAPGTGSNQRSAPSGTMPERAEEQPGVSSSLAPRMPRKKKVQVKFHQSEPSSSTPAELTQAPGHNTRAQVTRRLT